MLQCHVEVVWSGQTVLSVQREVPDQIWVGILNELELQKNKKREVLNSGCKLQFVINNTIRMVA